MNQEIEYIQKPMKLIKINEKKKQVKYVSPKLQKSTKHQQIQTKQQEPSIAQFKLDNLDENSNKEIINKQQSRASILSPVFTQELIIQKPIRRKTQIVKQQKPQQFFDSYILPKQVSCENETSHEQLLKQFYFESKQVSPKLSEDLSMLKQQNQKSGRKLQKFSKKQQIIKQYFNISKPLETDQTNLQSTPFQKSPLPSQNRKSHLIISPEIVNIHEVLRANRSNRSRDNEHQKHIAQFNNKVQDQLKQIKQQLKQIKKTQQLSSSRISQLGMQSRITSKATFDPSKLKDKSQVDKSPKVLKFDLSNNSSTPKPSKQLLTMSRAVNIRSDSKPTVTSRSKGKQVKQQKPKNIFIPNQKQNNLRKQQRSYEGSQKSQSTYKPRKQLLTTRIAKYN